MYRVNEIVEIKKYSNSQTNRYGKVLAIREGKIWVSNMDMPFSGSVNGWFLKENLRKVKEKHNANHRR